MGKPRAPSSPNYTQAAGAQAQQQRVDQYTPYGSMTYSNAGVDQMGTPTVRQDVTLNPEVQRALDAQLGMSAGLGEIAQGQLPAIQDQYAKPMDQSSVPAIADAAYGAFKSRLDPEWAQREQMQQTQLANQGLVPGGEAYDNSMRNFNQGRNDAYQQALLGSITTMPQTYQLANASYMQPLNTFNALRTGAQVQNPQFGSTPNAPNYLNAAQAQGLFDVNKYGIQTGAYNNMMGGLFGLGSSTIGAFGGG